MKLFLGFLAFSTILNVCDAQAAEPRAVVARYQYEPGYQRDPARITLLVKADGDLTYQHLDLISHATTTRSLGTLSPESIQILRHASGQLRSEDLKDLEAGRPHCTDLPTIQMSVMRADGQDIVISRSADCHHFDMPGSEAAAAIKNLLTGLVAFAALPVH